MELHNVDPAIDKGFYTAAVEINWKCFAMKNVSCILQPDPATQLSSDRFMSPSWSLLRF